MAVLAFCPCFLLLQQGKAYLPNVSDEKKFIALIDSIPSVAIQGYNRQRKVIYWNYASEIIYGYTKKEAFGKKLEDLIIPEEAKESVVAAITNWYQNGEPIPPSELYLRRQDGSTAHVFSSHVMLGDDNPEMFCLDIDLSEINKLKNENQQLEEKSQVDKMTGCYNRAYFESIVVDKIKQAKKHDQALSLIMFDIDNFKIINDTYGHDVGDDALILLIQIVKNNIRLTDTVARWGGEEFMLLVDAEVETAVNFAEKLRTAIESTTAKTSELPHFTCSFGVTNALIFNYFAEAYKAVDNKLYQAKHNGRNCVVF